MERGHGAVVVIFIIFIIVARLLQQPLPLSLCLPVLFHLHRLTRIAVLCPPLDVLWQRWIRGSNMKTGL
jgi:hypothetical protein